MPYIGNTKSKKIKKLYLLARTIIQSHGLRYFFYIIKLELKKQGLSMFAPDASPQPSFLYENYQNEYNAYLKQLQENLSREFLNESKLNSTITIMIIFDGDTKKLKLTVNSLQKQSYTNWNALVLSINLQTSMSAKISDYSNVDKITFIFDGKKLTDEITNSKSDLFCILRSGDILDDFSLSKSISHLNNNDSDIVYSDHDMIEDNLRKYPFFKPDWSPYLFRSMDYLSPFCIIKSEIFKKIQLEIKLLECIQYDILLKCAEITNKISHIALPLCSIPSQLLTKNNECNKITVQNHLNRLNIESSVESGILKNTNRIHYKLNSKPKVSILIPTKNNLKILKRCIESIEKKTNYSNKEIIVIDNDSDDFNVKQYFDKITHKVIIFKENFNFSKMNNLAVKQSTGDLLLFLNDDTKVLDPNWLDELVSICMQSDVGAVGPKLIFSDDTIQHAGMVFLKTGAGFHPGIRLEKNTNAHHNILNVMCDYSAVTGACLLVKKEVFDKVGGFDNQFDVYYGDSDLCLKIKDAGFRVIYTPFTKLLHEGSISIQYWHAGASFFDVENHQLFIKKWPHLKIGDPYYNSNLDWNYTISKNLL